MPLDRRELHRRLFSIASAQAGYFTAAEARRAGYSYQAQAYHVRAGNWLRVDRGVFRLNPWNPEPDDELIRWSLWAKGQGVISNESALAAHDLGEMESPKIHLAVPRRFSKADPAVALHRVELAPLDIQVRSGYRLTTPVRTLVDVADSADADQLARTIQEGRDRGLFSVGQLRDRAEAVDALAALRIERALQLLPA